MTRSLTGHRAPFVVTFSLAALTPCCQGDRRVTPPDETPTRPPAEVVDAPATATTTTASSSPSASASSRPSTKVWPFDSDLNLVNPKAGDKAIVYNGTCYTLGEEDETTSGIQFERHAVDCPQGIETLLANCTGDILTRHGDICSCSSPEGNPPDPERQVPCP